MKDAYQVLHQKEAELARVRREIASLRIAAPLLSADSPAKDSEREERSSDDDSGESEATGTDGLLSFATTERPRIWNVLRRGK
jgi:hypothetical protein